MSALLILVFGLIAGSFLGLCVVRLPRGQSVVRPGSRCPACGHRLRAWENLPVASFLFLRGRCRGCGIAIGGRYLAVELGTAAAFFWSWHRTGGGAEFVREAFFLACLVALAATDWECRQLPDEITLGGWACGLAFARWTAPGLPSALAASLGGAGLLALFGWVYQRTRGRPGLGWGDVKMIGLLGAFLGVAQGLIAVFLASVAGAGVGVVQAAAVLLQRRRRGHSWRRARASTAVFLARGAIPFGVFLAAAGVAALAWGPALWRAWLG